MARPLLSSEWLPYVNQFPLDTYDRFSLHESCLDLETEASRIFSGGGDIESWTREENGQVTISSMDEDRIETSKDVVYIIHQKNSWSRLQTSMDAIRKLCIAHNVSPVFFEALHAFGMKVTGEDDAYYNLGDLKTSQAPQSNGYEACYLIRAYEKHGRATLRDPWSLRQMLIYHRYNSKTQLSTWILIKPFNRCREALLDLFSQSNSNGIPHVMHMLAVGLVLPSWRRYLDHKRQLINQYSEKAEFSAAMAKGVDYTTGFPDCQRLHQIINTLCLAQHILISHEKIVCLLNANKVGTQEENRRHVRIIRGFTRTAMALQKHAEDTTALMSKLLEYRKFDALCGQATAITSLGTQSNTQTSHLRHLAEKSKEDTKFTKGLALIATLYLPVNLIAAIFSSDLIQIPRSISDTDSRPLVVPRAMWIFVICSLGLSGMTIFVSMFWSRFDRS